MLAKLLESRSLLSCRVSVKSKTLLYGRMAIMSTVSQMCLTSGPSAEDPSSSVQLHCCKTTHTQSHSIAQKTGASCQQRTDEWMYLEGLENAAEAEKKLFQGILLGERTYWLGTCDLYHWLCKIEGRNITICMHLCLYLHKEPPGRWLSACCARIKIWVQIQSIHRKVWVLTCSCNPSILEGQRREDCQRLLIA